MSDADSYEILKSKLLANNRFWSFDMDINSSISDAILIEKTLLYLDIEDINLLFKTYPKEKIKQIWLDRIALQGEFYARINRFIAWMYFDIKNPERYLKMLEHRKLKSYQ